jgi:hypothetical protein
MNEIALEENISGSDYVPEKKAEKAGLLKFGMSKSKQSDNTLEKEP